MPLERETVSSAVPCQIEMAGLRVMRGETVRTRSDHSRAVRSGAPFAGGALRGLSHGVEGAGGVAGRAEGKARDDRAAGEKVRVVRQHGGGHGSAGGKAGDEDALRVAAGLPGGMRHHLADRHQLAAVARHLARAEPSEAEARIVRLALLGIDDGKAALLGKRRPAGGAVVAFSVLPAAVQHQNQRTAGGKAQRNMFEHAQAAGIAAEIRDLDKGRRPGGAATGGGSLALGRAVEGPKQVA